jgi:hypothetical protein
MSRIKNAVCSCAVAKVNILPGQDNAGCRSDDLFFASDVVSSLAMRELRYYKPLGLFFLALLAVGILLGTLGPFGTFNDLSPFDRFVYWIVIVVLNGLQASVAIQASFYLLPAPKWPSIVPVTIGSVICSLVATMEVLWLEQTLRPETNGPGASFTEIYFLVLIVTLVVSFLFTHGPLQNYSVFRIPQDDNIEDVDLPAPADTETPFFSRISPGLGTDVICLEMEDHYIRVHTAVGDELILMRMRDAVAELEGFDGMQVHRSFWVARKRIVSVRRAGERGLLTMSNGLEIPVSRTRFRQLVDQKLLEL